MDATKPLVRARAFARRFDLPSPVLLAPMAGACPPSLSIAVAQGGGMGALGALLLSPGQIADWVAEYRAAVAAPLQINLWVPDPPPRRDPQHELRVREFLGQWGPPVAADAAMPLHDFDAQCDAVLAAEPAVISSVMGLYLGRLRTARSRLPASPGAPTSARWPKRGPRPLRAPI